MIWNEKFETMDREDLAQVQIERLQSALTRARRNVAFYRGAFEKAGVEIDDVRGTADLVRLPFTTKEDLRASYPYDMFAVPLRDIVRLHSTSGTTGIPVVVGYTRNDIRTWTECVARVLAAGGVTEHDVVQVAFTYGLFSGGLGFHYAAERIGASVVPSSAAGLEKQCLILRDFLTTALACTPSYALAISGALADLGIKPGGLPLRVGFFGAEPWSESLRAQLEETLHITALDNYGLTEVLGPGVSFECEAKSGLHVNEDHFIIEVIDPKTLAPAQMGCEGEMVFTTITKEGFPLIRYRTGDLGTLTDEPCSCGRRLARMSRIRGRLDDLIILGDVKVFPLQIEQIIAETQGLEPHYEIVLDRVGGRDTLEVRVEISENMPEMDEMRALEHVKEGIVRKLDTVLGVQAKVTLVEPRTLTRTAAAGSPGGAVGNGADRKTADGSESSSGKIKRVVDKRMI
jgi:phenylacetate-CoA ligase